MARKIILGLFLLIATTSVLAKTKPKLATAHRQDLNKQLHFMGTISPLTTVPVISKTSGIIAKKHFRYGESIKAGSKLLEINAGKAAQNLRDAEVSYLKALASFNNIKNWQASDDMINATNSLVKAKRELSHSQTTYEQNKQLFSMGIISEDELRQSHSNYQDNKMSFDHAQHNLNKTKAKGKGRNLTIAKLELKNAREKYESLVEQTKSTCITAPASGVILLPTANSDNKKASGKLTVGDSVQFQQSLLTIGDMSGLTINLKVPEVNINQIRANQKATITGDAFSSTTLHGKVSTVAAQAQSSNGGSSPSFNVTIKVPSITAKQARIIKVGMKAQISLTVFNQKQALVVPVAAVHKDHNQQFVYLYNSKTNKKTKQTISTGMVVQDQVQVTKGLQPGQHVVLDSN